MTAENTPKPLEITLPFTIRTYDIDFAGVVSNIVYIRWLEDMRLTILEKYYPLERLLEEGIAPTLVSTNIRYLRPLTIWDKPVIGRMWMSSVRRLKFSFTGEILVDGKAAIHAEQVGCLIYMNTGKFAPIPRELLEAFDKDSG